MGDCPICGGRGMVADHFTSRMVPTTESQPPLKSKRCPHCHGTGWTPRMPQTPPQVVEDDRIARMLAEVDNSGEDWRRIAADSLEGVAATLRRGYDKAACETLERCLRQIRGYQTAKTLRERLGAIAEGGSK